MEAQITSTKEFNFNNYGYRSYRIEEKDENGFHFQRHIWTTVSGEIEIEKWLLTGRNK